MTATSDPGSSPAPAQRIPGIPRLRGGHLPRPSLRERLDEDVPLILLRAPAGFGKTSLLAEWAREARPTDTSAAWVTVDPANSGRISFWRSVIAALTAAEVPGTDGLTRIAPAADISTTLRTRLLEATPLLRGRITLIIEGVDHLDEQTLADILAVLHRNDHLRVLASARRRTILESPLQAASIDVTVLGTEDLAFTPEQVHALARSLGRDIDGAEAERMHAQTAGWPIAVRAALHAPPRSLADHPHGVDALQAELLDTLRGETYFTQLRNLAVVTAVDLPLARELGAGAELDAAWERLAERGLGEWSDTGPRPVFRLQPLLRDALEQDLHSTDRVALNATLARWLLAHGRPVEALPAALRAGAWADAARCVRLAFADIVEDFSSFDHLLSAIPLRTLHAHPALALLRALSSYRSGNQLRAFAVMGPLVAALETRALFSFTGSTTPEQVWAQASVTAGLRLMGVYEHVETALAAFHRLLSRVNDPDGELDAARAVFRAEETMTLLLLDRPEAALRAAREPVPEHDASERRASYAAALRAYAAAASGDLPTARRHLDEHELRAGPRFPAESFYAVPALLAASVLHRESGHSAEALAVLEPASVHWSTIEHWPLILAERCRALLHTSGPDAALLALRSGRAEKEGRARISAPLREMLDALHAELLLAGGDVAAAEEHLRAHRGARSARFSVPRARMEAQRGRAHQALSLADEALTRADLGAAERLSLLTLTAGIARALGDDDLARQRFSAAVDHADRSGLRTPMTVLSEEDLTALRALTAAQPDTAALDPDSVVDEVRGVSVVEADSLRAVDLTPREQAVLVELATDASIPRIAEALFVSVNTVKSQCQALYRKLGVHGREDAVDVARRSGLI